MTNGEWATLLEKRCANMQKQMTDLRTAAQQALEAMEQNTKHLPLHFDNYFEAMHALRAALAEPYIGGKKE